jgi:hypothetical protein
MHAIKDSVHDHVPVTPLAADLLDTPLLQRLRHIKQLSTVRLVYPSASHTRFEHSLGVYHLASRALEHLDVTDEEANHVRAAALLHDVGHGPYGHQTEGVLVRHLDRTHDEVADLLAGSAAADALRAHDVSPERVAGLVDGRGPLGDLVSGAVDVDRMDYLVRDAHHTGVPYGTIDHERLVRELRYVDGGGGSEGRTTGPANGAGGGGAGLALAEGNVRTAEALLVARGLMNWTVYRHHVSRVAGAMLELAAERLLAGGLPATAFARMADHDLLVALRDRVPDLGRRIEYRDLYKRAVWAGIDAVPEAYVGLPFEESRAAAREVADRAGVEPTQVVVDAPSPPTFRESGARVVVDGAVRRLADVSELVSAVRAVERDQWRLGVYAPAEHRAVVADAAVAVLGLPDRVARHG